MNRNKPIKNRKKLARKNYFSFLPAGSFPRAILLSLFGVTAIVAVLLFSALRNGFEVDGAAVFGIFALIAMPTAILFAVFTVFEKLTDMSWLRGLEWIGKHTLIFIDKGMMLMQSWRGIESNTNTDTLQAEPEPNMATVSVIDDMTLPEPVFADFLAEEEEDALETSELAPVFNDIADDHSGAQVDTPVDDPEIDNTESVVSLDSDQPLILDEAIEQSLVLDADSMVERLLHGIEVELPESAATQALADDESGSQETSTKSVDSDNIDIDKQTIFEINPELPREADTGVHDDALHESLENEIPDIDITANEPDNIEGTGITVNHSFTKSTESADSGVSSGDGGTDSRSSLLMQAEQTAASIISSFSAQFAHSSDERNKVAYQLPALDLLEVHQQSIHAYNNEELDEISASIERVLKDYKISAEVMGAYPGPVITRFELSLAPGIKVSRVSSLAKDLARAMLVTSVRVVEIIEGTPYIGLEIPNQERELVSFREILSSDAFQEASSALTLALGKDVSGETVVADLAKMPHLLVAGTTGSGKSVAINSMILSLLYKSTPEQVRMIMVDPKMLELSIYEGIPHLLTPVVTDMKEAQNALRWAVAEMERRYKLMSKVGVRNLAGFNQMIEDAAAKGERIRDPLYQRLEPLAEGESFPVLSTLPSIVIVIDELADMMMIVGKKVEELIARLAQKARAAGIHLVLATQRPSVDVLTGLIKANVPTRLSFQVSSRIDSRTIIDQGGAEALLGNGDMLFLPSGTSVPLRAHGAFVDDHEVHSVVDYLKSLGEANYLSEITQEESVAVSATAESAIDEVDTLYAEAVNFVMETGKASISSVQRRFKVGYNRAARMIDQMQEEGIVSEPEGNGSRRILNKDE